MTSNARSHGRLPDALVKHRWHSAPSSRATTVQITIPERTVIVSSSGLIYIHRQAQIGYAPLLHRAGDVDRTDSPPASLWVVWTSAPPDLPNSLQRSRKHDRR